MRKETHSAYIAVYNWSYTTKTQLFAKDIQIGKFEKVFNHKGLI
jgi:hypothetical protein